MSVHSQCEHNCGGTDCPAPVHVALQDLSTSPTGYRCSHPEAFNLKVRFWIFSKTIRVCPHCHKELK